MSTHSFMYEVTHLLKDVCARNVSIYLKEEKGIEISEFDLVAIMMKLGDDEQKEQLKIALDEENEVVEVKNKTEDKEVVEVKNEDKEEIKEEKQKEVKKNTTKKEKEVKETKEETKEDTPKEGCCYILGRSNKNKKKGDRCNDAVVKNEEYCKKHMKYKNTEKKKENQVENGAPPSVVDGMVTKPNEEEEQSASIRPLTKEDLVMEIGEYQDYQLEINRGYLVKQLPSGVFLAEFIKNGDKPRPLTSKEKTEATAAGFAVIKNDEEVKEVVAEEVKEEMKEEEMKEEEAKEEEVKEVNEEVKEEVDEKQMQLLKIIDMLDNAMPGFKEKSMEEKIMQAMKMMNNL